MTGPKESGNKINCPYVDATVSARFPRGHAAPESTCPRNRDAFVINQPVRSLHNFLRPLRFASNVIIIVKHNLWTWTVFAHPSCSCSETIHQTATVQQVTEWRFTHFRQISRANILRIMSYARACWGIEISYLFLNFTFVRVTACNEFLWKLWLRPIIPY